MCIRDRIHTIKLIHSPSACIMSTLLVYTCRVIILSFIRGFTQKEGREQLLTDIFFRSKRNVLEKIGIFRGKMGSLPPKIDFNFLNFILPPLESFLGTPLLLFLTAECDTSGQKIPISLNRWIYSWRLNFLLDITVWKSIGNVDIMPIGNLKTVTWLLVVREFLRKSL